MSPRTLIWIVALGLAAAGAGAGLAAGLNPSPRAKAHAKQKVVRASTQTPATRKPPVSNRPAGSDPAKHWTPQRMRDAQPAPMGRPGGQAVSSQQTPGGVAGGRSEAGKTLHAKEDSVRSKQQTPAARTPPVATRPAGSDPATYWTPKRMRDAQPAPMGRPGGPTASPSSPEPAPGGTAGGKSDGSGTVVDGP